MVKFFGPTEKFTKCRLQECSSHTSNGLLLVSLAAIAGKTRAICVTQGSSTGESSGYSREN